MIKVDKENIMLVDVQYVNPRTKGMNDYLYIVYKDLTTGEKYIETIESPKKTIYIEKPEFRDHNYNKTYCEIDKCQPVTVTHRNTLFEIAKLLGDEGKRMVDRFRETRDFNTFKQQCLLNPYIYGADIDIRVWYREKFKSAYTNNKIKNVTVGYLDIETDIMESNGRPDPVFNPIDLVTYIDGPSKTSYTFALVGVDYFEVDENERRTFMTEEDRKRLYEHRTEEQSYWTTHTDEIIQKAHEMFDDDYADMKYKVFFYKDEAKMLIHLFELINSLKRDMIFVWNIAFDIPFIIERLKVLGLEPADVMCHKDFPVKECWFKDDKKHFEIPSKSHFFHCSSYTVWLDQMVIYAASRKGQGELRSHALDAIAEIEVDDKKLDYGDSGISIKTLSYNDYLMYVLYNIKDVLLQMAINEATDDSDTYYLYSEANLTPYENVFQQSIKLRNVIYKSFLNNGMIISNDFVGIKYYMNNGTYYAVNEHADELDEDSGSDEDGDKKSSKKKSKFEGALVGNPTLITDFGVELYGKKTNNIFKYSADFDMGAFYPSTIEVMNIDPNCLIFKMEVMADIFENRGGTYKYNGITDDQIVDTNSDSFTGDISKEIMDNYQSKHYLSFGYKWLNLPSISEIYDELEREGIVNNE